LKAGEVQGKVIGKIDNHTDKAGRREEQLLGLHRRVERNFLRRQCAYYA
jgi:hypothetical protein